MKTATRPRIAVVGLKNNQQKAVEDACDTVASILFVDQRRPPKGLPHTDHIVLMIKFIKHGWTRTSLATIERDKVHLHRGGVSSLVETIEAICA